MVRVFQMFGKLQGSCVVPTINIPHRPETLFLYDIFSCRFGFES